MRRRYTVILEAESKGGYRAFCPALPGGHSEGETVEEALRNAQEAAELYVESLLAHGEPAPEEPPLLIAAAEFEADAPTTVGPACSHQGILGEW